MTIKQFIIKYEPKIIRLAIYLIGFIGLYLIHFFITDGVLYNKVIHYRYGVNPLAFQTDKTAYKRGEVIKIITSFCKTRKAYATVEYNLVNDEIINLKTTAPKDLPKGCYPASGGYTLIEVSSVPQNSTNGTHYIVGTRKEYLKSGAVRTTYIRTVNFEVID